MRSSEFLCLSEWLMREPSRNEEASFRTAIDRAYLASALLLADVLRGRFGIEIPRTTKFYHMIEERAADLDSYFKEKIATLRELRNDADYDLILTFDRHDAKRAITIAKEMTSQLSDKFS